MTWIYLFDPKFVGLLVIVLTRTLTESGQDLSPGLSDPGGQWLLGLVSPSLCEQFGSDRDVERP